MDAFGKNVVTFIATAAVCYVIVYFLLAGIVYFAIPNINPLKYPVVILWQYTEGLIIFFLFAYIHKTVR